MVHKEGRNCRKEQILAASETVSECFSSPQPERKRGKIISLLGGTNLDCENLITVQTCVGAVVRRALKRGSDKWKEVRNKQEQIVCKQEDVSFGEAGWCLINSQ